MTMAVWWGAAVMAVLLVLVPRCGYSGTSKHMLTSTVGIILIIGLILALLGRV